MKLVFDSSSLIYFARSRALAYVTELPADKYLPPVVYDEVVTTGRAGGYPDAEVVDQFIQQGLFRVVTPEKNSIERLKDLHRDLHPGEMEVLALADDIKGTAIMDDRIGREIGEMFGIEVRGSAFILFVLVRHGIITKEKAKQVIRLMVREGFRIGAEQYALFLDLLDHGTYGDSP